MYFRPRIKFTQDISFILLIFFFKQQVVKRMTMEKDLEDWEVYDELKGKKKGNFRMPGAGSVTEVRFVFYFEMFYSLLLSYNHLCMRILFKHV